MLIKTMCASPMVIAAALIGSQSAWAQETTAPGPATNAPAPSQSAPVRSPPPQPNTTAIPPSDPAIAPQASAPAAEPNAPADSATQTAQPAPAPTDPAANAPAPAEQTKAAPAAPASGNSQAVTFVESQFPSLDVDADGALTTTEFEGWISKLKTAELEAAGKPVDDQEVKTYAQNALLSADADSDKKVTKAEATQFFSG